MAKELQIKLRSKNPDESGNYEFQTFSQQFIALKHVLAWMKLEERITASIVDNIGSEVFSPSQIMKERIDLIADMFDSPEITRDAILERGNAMDKIIKNVEAVVIDQYSDGDDESGKD